MFCCSGALQELVVGTRDSKEWRQCLEPLGKGPLAGIPTMLICTILCEDFLLLQGRLQEPAAPNSEAWRQHFKPLDEGIPAGLPSTPEIPPADSAEDYKVTKPADKGADVEASSAKIDSNAADRNGAAKGQGGADGAAGVGQLAPAKSGKLESKERISSMLQSASADSAAQQVNSEAKGRKMGCFGRSGQAKESSRPCAIF